MMQTKEMEIDIASQGEHCVVRVYGDINWRTSPELRTAILELTEKHLYERIIVDLSGAAHLDSSGVSSFIEALVAAKRQGSRFILSGLSEQARHLLELTRLTGVFEIAGSVEQALR